MADDQKSKNIILQALVALRHNLYQASAAARRTTSLALPCFSDGDDNAAGTDAVPAEAPRPLSRPLSMSLPLLSPYQSMPNQDKHIGMQRLDYLFSVEVVAARGLPPSMNGLLLAVAVRRKETRDGTVQTMPARVQNGAADFEETLYVRCHLYRSGGSGMGKPLKFEPWPFLISAVAIGAPELDLGQCSVDFSAFVKEFMEKCQQGECPSQWDATFPLSGKARGGDLVVKLAFQIMEGLGLVVNSQTDVVEKATNSSWSSSFAQKVTKSSFIVMSPKILRSQLSFMPKMGVSTPDLKGTDNLKLDKPAPTAEVKAAAPAQQKEPEHKLKLKEAKQEEQEQKESEPEPKAEDEKSDDSELPEFDVVEKGIEGQEEVEAEKAMEATGLNAVLDAVAELVEQLEDIGEEVTGESLQPPVANGDRVIGEPLQSSKANKLPEANGDEVTGEFSQPLEADKEKVSGDSLQPLEANRYKVTGESLQPSAKSPPRRIRWRTLAIIFAPVAIMICRALAGRMSGKH